MLARLNDVHVAEYVFRLAAALRLGSSGAVHANRLFLQSFCRPGIVGLGAILVFLWFLVRYALRAAKDIPGGGIAMLEVFFMGAMFLVPLQPNSILGAELFAMIFFFLCVIDRGVKPNQEVLESGPGFINHPQVQVAK